MSTYRKATEGTGKLYRAKYNALIIIRILAIMALVFLAMIEALKNDNEQREKIARLIFNTPKHICLYSVSSSY